MGRGITVSLAQAGVSVIAVETHERQLAEAKEAVSAMLERGAKRRRLAPPPPGLVRYSQDLQGAAEAELVIEAVSEDRALKERLFQQLSGLCGPDTLLCTNTSSLDVDRLAACTRRPELVAGMHFFAPAHVMRLLEVVRGPRSSPVAVATAVQLGRRIGKVCVVVGNGRGFVGNRMLKPYMEQASFLLEEGATPQTVDGALEEFGMAMGPFRMSDLSGLDVGWRVRREEHHALSGPQTDPRVRQGRRYSPLADLLCQEGRLGQKTGRGWYRYEGPGGRAALPDPWLAHFLERYRAQHGLEARRVPQQEALERCLYALINEGFRILEEGVAAGPEDVDVVYTLGYGWPRHRGGPMFYAATVGLARVLETLERLHQAHSDVPQLEPSSLLRRLVAIGSPPLQRWRGVIQTPHSQL